jgi:transposase
LATYRNYPPVEPALFGYDPAIDLPNSHLARFVDRVVEQVVTPKHRVHGQGQAPFDPRLCIKVLIYSYATGVRSSRQMERLCDENLAVRLLTRGDTPSYRTLCTARIQYRKEIELVWEALFLIAAEEKIDRLGKLTLDSTKIRADASSEAVLKQAEYEPMRRELEKILAEAEAADAREESEGSASHTVLDKEVSVERMREILRRVRQEPKKESSSPAEEAPASRPLGKRMVPRLKKAIASIDKAAQEGRKHLCLTDPDARMAAVGTSHQIRECHNLEVAADNGLIVAAGATTEPDNGRAPVLVDAAQAREPNGVTEVTADSGYWRAGAIQELEARGISTCIPDSNTACDLRRGQAVGTTASRPRSKIPFSYEESSDSYVCPENNRLVFKQVRTVSGSSLRMYQAERECGGCPLASQCLQSSEVKRRSLQVRVDSESMRVLSRFSEREHLKRYWARGPAVESIFGFMRRVLGFVRWMLRGSDRVGCEATLFMTAYQFRKIHRKRMMRLANG